MREVGATADVNDAIDKKKLGCDMKSVFQWCTFTFPQQQNVPTSIIVYSLGLSSSHHSFRARADLVQEMLVS